MTTNDMTSPPAPLHDGEGGVPKRESVVAADVIPALFPNYWGYYYYSMTMNDH
jgi:hypothetical protein